MAKKEALLRPDLAGARLRDVVVFLAVRLRGAAIILYDLNLNYICSGALTPSKSKPLAMTWRVALARLKRASFNS